MTGGRKLAGVEAASRLARAPASVPAAPAPSSPDDLADVQTTPRLRTARPKTTVIDGAWEDFVPGPAPAAPPPPPPEEVTAAWKVPSDLLEAPVDDLDGETNVLSGQDLAAVRMPQSSPEPATRTPAPAATPKPAARVAPAAAQPAPAAAQPALAAQPAAPARVASVVAVRVAVIGRAGDVRVVPLAAGAAPPPGAAIAMLVPLGHEDAATIGKLVGL